ncbi:hypothetical protein C8J57DRAFT_1337798 [Mycena rebaudengoi]|nr:hypothetical protein C8J57DRAFT_1337798 [Mycena rebaudengoi]
MRSAPAVESPGRGTAVSGRGKTCVCATRTQKREHSSSIPRVVRAAPPRPWAFTPASARTPLLTAPPPPPTRCAGRPRRIQSKQGRDFRIPSLCLPFPADVPRESAPKFVFGGRYSGADLSTRRRRCTEQLGQLEVGVFDFRGCGFANEARRWRRRR